MDPEGICIPKTWMDTPEDRARMAAGQETRRDADAGTPPSPILDNSAESSETADEDPNTTPKTTKTDARRPSTTDQSDASNMSDTSSAASTQDHGQQTASNNIKV